MTNVSGQSLNRSSEFSDEDQGNAAISSKEAARFTNASLQIIEFEDFHQADAASPDPINADNRRFMTLFCESDQPILGGAVGKIIKVRNAVGEVFACKMLHSAVTSPTPEPLGADTQLGRLKAREAIDRSIFGEEYRVQCMLSNVRGFPKIYGYGIYKGSPVLIMEWIEGMTLKEAASRLQTDGAIPSSIISSIGYSVLETLQRTETLDASVIHRDLSPNNIMIRTDRTSWESQIEAGEFDICLVDFGSSAFAENPNPAFTQIYNIWRNGTPEYAAPEMLTNDIAGAEKLRSSQAVDVYALCSVLYELYSGCTPYQLARRMVASAYRTKMDQVPEPLVARTSEDEWLVSCIMQGLSARQQDRPTMEQLMDALKNKTVWGKSDVVDQPASQVLPTPAPVAPREPAMPTGATPTSVPAAPTASTMPTVVASTTGAPMGVAERAPLTTKKRKPVAIFAAITVAIVVAAVVAIGAITAWNEGGFGQIIQELTGQTQASQGDFGQSVREQAVHSSPEVLANEYCDITAQIVTLMCSTSTNGGGNAKFHSLANQLVDLYPEEWRESIAASIDEGMSSMELGITEGDFVVTYEMKPITTVEGSELSAMVEEAESRYGSLEGPAPDKGAKCEVTFNLSASDPLKGALLIPQNEDGAYAYKLSDDGKYIYNLSETTINMIEANGCWYSIT